MNKRDMQQLKASIAKDLIQGQSDNSATRDLAKAVCSTEWNRQQAGA